MQQANELPGNDSKHAGLKKRVRSEEGSKKGMAEREAEREVQVRLRRPGLAWLRVSLALAVSAPAAKGGAPGLGCMRYGGPA